MPELPEVETTRRGLETFLKNARIEKVTVHQAMLRRAVPKALKKSVEGAKVKKLERRAKYLLLHLDNGQTIILHLGMSGRLFKKTEPYTPSQHDHVVFETDKGDAIIFRDPRRFGLIDIAPTKDLKNHPLLKQIGPEPFDNKLAPQILYDKFKNKKTPVKAALLDQHMIAGLGNIYILEALHDCRILPTRLCNQITPAECKKLLPSIRKILTKAIEWGGSSLRDYAHVDGQLGKFKHHFMVYDRTGEKCLRKSCTGTIKRIAQGGRSSFFCPVCQH